jgi:ankyrin repeat protein
MASDSGLSSDVVVGGSAALRELFLRSVICTAQNGYARDVEPFLGLCRDIWWEVQIFDALKDLPHGSRRVWDARKRVRGAWVVQPHARMRTRVMYNAFAGNVERLTWLIERGARLELRDAGGRTALAWAARGDSASCVAVLAARGADVEARCAAGETPLQVAVKGRAWGAVGALLAAGAAATAAQKMDWLSAVGRAGSVGGCLAIVTAAGDAPGAQGAALGVALFAACEGGHAPLVDALLAAGAALEAVDEFGERPLSVAIKAGHAALAVALLEKGASVHGADYHDGNTCLHWATERGLALVVPLLLARGADAGARNAFGQTPAALCRGSVVRLAQWRSGCSGAMWPHSGMEPTDMAPQ